MTVDLETLSGATLLFDVEDKSTLSLLHHAQLSRDGGVNSIADSTIAILRQIADGDLVVSAGPPDEQTCRRCGCVQDFACDVGCTRTEPDLCSACATAP